MKIKQLIKYYFYRFKWYTAKYINYSSPVHLDIELSTRCNLNCEFCFRQDYKYEQKDIDNNLARNVILQAEKLGIRSIKFNWRGEATLNKNFKDIIYFAKSLDLHTMLNTSLAMQLNQRQVENIAKNIDELDISIDSMNKETYEKIRKGANFELTLSNLKRLYNYRQKYNMPTIVINRRTSELTTESDEQFIYQLNQIGKFKYDIRPAMPRNKNDIYESRKKIYKWQTKKFNYSMTIIKGRKYCGQPSRRMVVDVDGNVWACCVSYTQDKGLFLGNIKEQSLKDIWNLSKRKYIVRNLKKHRFHCDTCKNCTSGDSYK